MSQAASQAHAFYRDVAANRRLWTIRDERGFPAPLKDGVRTQPFWSTLSRVQRIIRVVSAYSEFQPHEVTWDDFRDHWLPSLTRDGHKVGVNWSGPHAVGYDLDPASVRRWVEHEISQFSNGFQRDSDHDAT